MSAQSTSPPTDSTASATSCGASTTDRDSATGENQSCNHQITDGVTQSSVHTLGLGPAVAAVNSYLGQAQSQSILFANMVNQQAQAATIANTALTQELTQLFSLGDAQ